MKIDKLEYSNCNCSFECWLCEQARKDMEKLAQEAKLELPTVADALEKLTKE